MIGINSQIESGGQGNPGKSASASPSRSTPPSEIAQQLIDTGQVQHAFLGISGTDLTPQIADVLNLQANSGALVKSVVLAAPPTRPGSPLATPR